MLFEQLWMSVQGPGTNEFKQSCWSKALNRSQGMRVQDQKSGKLRLNLHGTWFGGKNSWVRPKNSAKRRAPDLENQESGWGPRLHSNSRIQFASDESKLVPRKLDPWPSTKVGLSVKQIPICQSKTWSCWEFIDMSFWDIKLKGPNWRAFLTFEDHPI
jgi:hypothetical protein